MRFRSITRGENILTMNEEQNKLNWLLKKKILREKIMKSTTIYITFTINYIKFRS